MPEKIDLPLRPPYSNMKKNNILSIALVLLISIGLGACGSTKQSVYFKSAEALDSSYTTQRLDRTFVTIIRPDDILSINITSVSSINEMSDPVSIYREGGTIFSTTAAVGQGNISGGGNNSGSSPRAGFLVDKEGYIDFPVLGKLQVAGLSIRQAKDLLVEKLKAHIHDPVVEVRIINYKVVVMGEVANPGTVLAPNHTISIPEAMAAVGDILITGRKDNVLLVREENNQRKFVRLDLTSKDIFKSPYYYLKQNDILSVEPNNVRRQQQNEFLRVYLPLVTSLLSTAITVYGLVKIAQATK